MNSGLPPLPPPRRYSYYNTPVIGAHASRLMTLLGDNDTPATALNVIGNWPPLERFAFLSEYKHLTKFPDLAAVSKGMIQHARSVIELAGEKSGLKVLWSGFHRHCSVAKGLAFPGSDIDATCIITADQDQTGDGNAVNDLRRQLWRGYNPLVVSIRKYLEFPDVFTVKQLQDWTRFLDRVIHHYGLPEERDTYRANLKETKNFSRALAFNRHLAQLMDKVPVEDIVNEAPTLRRILGDTKPRHITLAMASMLETLRSGNVLIDSRSDSGQTRELNKLRNTALYQYANMSMQDADWPTKTKLAAREKMLREDYAGMDIDHQLALVEAIIRHSQDGPTETPAEFVHLFDNAEANDHERHAAFEQCA